MQCCHQVVQVLLESSNVDQDYLRRFRFKSNLLSSVSSKKTWLKWSLLSFGPVWIILPNVGLLLKITSPSKSLERAFIFSKINLALAPATMLPYTWPKTVFSYQRRTSSPVVLLVFRIAFLLLYPLLRGSMDYVNVRWLNFNFFGPKLIRWYFVCGW